MIKSLNKNLTKQCVQLNCNVFLGLEKGFDAFGFYNGQFLAIEPCFSSSPRN